LQNPDAGALDAGPSPKSLAGTPTGTSW